MFPSILLLFIICEVYFKLILFTIFSSIFTKIFFITSTFKRIIYLFIWLSGVLVAASGLSWSVQVPECVGLVVVFSLSCQMAYGILVSGPEIELASPALEGGFLTTGTPGSPSHLSLFFLYTWDQNNFWNLFDSKSL